MEFHGITNRQRKAFLPPKPRAKKGTQNLEMERQSEPQEHLLRPSSASRPMTWPTKVLFLFVLGFCHLNVKDPDLVHGTHQDENKIETKEQDMRVNAVLKPKV